jgi:hypothetical protein
MKAYMPRERETVEAGEQALAAMREQTERLRRINELLAGPRRAELRVIRGGKDA